MWAMVDENAKTSASTPANKQEGSEMSQSESDAGKEHTDREEDEEEDEDEDDEDIDGEDEEEDEGDDEDVEAAGDDEEEPAPKIQLPDRSTRGKRMARAIEEEEEEADNSFWNQDFFAEEQKDDNYKTESEEEDVADSDFDKSESSDDDEDGEEKVKRVRRLGPKKEQLPGYKQAALRAARKAAKLRARGEKEKKRKADGGDDAPSAADSAAGEKPSKRVRIADPEDVAKAPTLRRSTYRRVLDDEIKRRQEENNRSARKRTERPDEPPPLEAAMVLEDAVTTEFLNQQSLQILLAQEEETKAKANLTKQRATGPRVRWVSSREGDASSSHVMLLEIAPSALPTGLRREANPPAPTNAFVVDRMGEVRPRTSRKPPHVGGEANGAWVGVRQGLTRPPSRLLTGEDVSDVRGFGDLRALPWGGAVLEPQAPPVAGFGSNGLHDQGALAGGSMLPNGASFPFGDGFPRGLDGVHGLGLEAGGRGGAASSSGRGRAPGRGRGRGAKRGPGRPAKAQPPAQLPEAQNFSQYASPQFPAEYMAGNNLLPMMHAGNMPIGALHSLPTNLSMGGNTYFNKSYQTMHGEGVHGGLALDMRRAVGQQHFNGGVGNAPNGHA